MGNVHLLPVITVMPGLNALSMRKKHRPNTKGLPLGSLSLGVLLLDATT